LTRPRQKRVRTCSAVCPGANPFCMMARVRACFSGDMIFLLYQLRPSRGKRGITPPSSREV
jgi:hypothetical protein